MTIKYNSENGCAGSAKYTNFSIADERCVGGVQAISRADAAAKMRFATGSS